MDIVPVSLCHSSATASLGVGIELRNICGTRLVAFDLDDTLAHSKSPITPEMSDALMSLIGLKPVCIISGGRFEQFEVQVLDYLPATRSLENLHLMPTCGTRYLRWHSAGWVEEYAHNLDTPVKLHVVQVLEAEARRLGLWEEDADTHGERIEDRGSQITLSALGQRAPVEAKRRWDPDGSKREVLRAAVAAQLPDLEVRSGGSTSIDITEKGIDKAYGMRRIAEMLAIELSQIHFVGDRLEPGGNDYPVLAAGVSTHAVVDCDETLEYIRELVAYLR